MTSRREFLGAAALSATRVLGANDRINVGIIGVGGMGFGHVRMLKPRTDIRITSISDIYTKRKQRAKDFLGLTDRDIHHDYKDLLARSDVDAVFVVTPDHWHYRMAMDALDAVAQGLIGKPLWAQGTYCRNTLHGEWNYEIDAEGIEDNIDWKRFLGSAPKRAFSQDRYFRWRKYWDYSGGIATDLLYHRLVPFLVTLGPQFPLRVSSNGGIYVHKDREVPDTVSTTIEYPEFQVVMSSSMAADLPGAHLSPVIYGHKGTIEFRGKELVITPEPIYTKTGQQPLRIPSETLDLHIAHMENFFDCMRSRKPPNLNADFGYRAMVAIGMGVEAYRESRQLNFDPVTERMAKAAPKREAYEGNGKNVDESTRS